MPNNSLTNACIHPLLKVLPSSPKSPPPLLLLNHLPKSVELEFWVLVADLHRLTPSNFLEASGAILHPISYMQARNGNLAINSGL